MLNDHSKIILSIAKALTESNPQAIYLELGTATGYVFNQVAPLFKEAWGVDSNGGAYEYIKQNANLKWHNKYTDDFISTCTTTFDMVFIDADHHHEQSLKDFQGIVPFVKPNGLILLHDTYPLTKTHLGQEWSGDTYKTAWYIRQNMKDDFEIVTIPFCCGISIIRKSKKQIVWLENE